MCSANVSKKSFGSNGNNNFLTSFALFCKTLSEGPTPHAMENLIKVCNLAGPATPIWTGISIPFLISESAHSITGPASKQNWVVKAKLMFVLSLNFCFQLSASSTFLEELSGSISLFLYKRLFLKLRSSKLTNDPK